MGPRLKLAGGAVELQDELAAAIAGEVRFDDGARALYATDGSNYRQVPIGVVIPRSKDDVVAAVEICRRHGVPILPRGGGTSLAGQCCNVAVVIDGSKYLHGVLALDGPGRTARVLPGTVLDTLRGAANRRGLTFAPDPATHAYCTLGGMIGNNSCGPHSIMAGRTSDNVEELEVLTYDGLRMRVGATTPEQLDLIIAVGGRRGEIYRAMRALRDRYADLIRARYPKIPRRVSGYNLDELLPERGFHVARALVGSEGTLVTVLEAQLRLVPWPPHRALLVVGYRDIFRAADHVPALQAGGDGPEQRPIAIEAVDELLVRNVEAKHLADAGVRRLPRGKAFLLVEFGGETRDECTARARDARARIRREGGVVDARVLSRPDEQQQVWALRESALGATARDASGKPAWEGWEDSAVPVERLGDYLRELQRTLEAHGYRSSMYGHFGQGCVHTRIPFDFGSERGLANYRAFMLEATDLVVRFGGSLSGEHGDGQARAEYLPKLFGPELIEAFRQFKRIWDPAWSMNPGKVVDAQTSTQNLRLGPDAVTPALETHFRYPDDGGSFARATQRCVGVGKCRRSDGGTMCPSFMVLKDEEHTTRGRAHLLFEMTRGQHLGGWRDEHVKESLDLCLSCKGCKGDCPVGVDVATYKAEFLAHYYEGRLRPRAAYAMGLIHRWARLARIAPGLANLIGQTPGLRRLVKWVGQIAPERELPRFAARTFTRQFAGAQRARERERDKAGRAGARRGPVVLWPDTFTNHFHPGVGMSAAAALSHLGYEVLVPQQPVCCGRPLYDWGMLKAAKRRLLETLAVLRAPLRAGLPVVVLEPSCLSVMKDEARSLFPLDDDVRRLGAQAVLFSDFLARAELPLPRVGGRALVQGHCHQRSLVGMEGERTLLHQLGLDAEILDAGCCGMAGAFGFERGEKYDVSVRAAERRLLPAVRAADANTTIVTDGFSCREQIRQLGGRPARHVAEVVCDALGAGESVREPDASRRWDNPAQISVPAAIAVGVGGTLAALGAAFTRRRASGTAALAAVAVGGLACALLASIQRRTTRATKRHENGGGERDGKKHSGRRDDRHSHRLGRGGGVRAAG